MVEAMIVSATSTTWQLSAANILSFATAGRPIALYLSMLISAACQRYMSSARVSPITCFSNNGDCDRVFHTSDR